jgi:uncharacterized membrane protein YfcA
VSSLHPKADLALAACAGAVLAGCAEVLAWPERAWWAYLFVALLLLLVALVYLGGWRRRRRRPPPYLVGERGPELFVPHDPERRP